MAEILAGNVFRWVAQIMAFGLVVGQVLCHNDIHSKMMTNVTDRDG